MKLNTRILTVLVALLCSQSVQSQCYGKLLKGKHQFVRKHQLNLKAGIGLVPTFFMDKAKTLKHPTTFGADFFLSKNVSIGLFYGSSVQQYEKYFPQIDQQLQVKNEHRNIGGRLLAHLAKRSRWNVFGGFGVSRHESKIEITAEEITFPIALITTLRTRLRMLPKESSFVFSGIIGGQYFLNKRFSLTAEVGNNISLATAGINYTISL